MGGAWLRVQGLGFTAATPDGARPNGARPDGARSNGTRPDDAARPGGGARPECSRVTALKPVAPACTEEDARANPSGLEDGESLDGGSRERLEDDAQRTSATRPSAAATPDGAPPNAASLPSSEDVGAKGICVRSDGARTDDDASSRADDEKRTDEDARADDEKRMDSDPDGSCSSTADRYSPPC